MSPDTATMARLRREDISRTEDARRTANASTVLQAALDHGPVARSTIARLAALSPAAVSRLCADLIAAGLLREAPEPRPLSRWPRPDGSWRRRECCSPTCSSRSSGWPRGSPSGSPPACSWS